MVLMEYFSRVILYNGALGLFLKYIVLPCGILWMR